jgi:hypothetical protein
MSSAARTAVDANRLPHRGEFNVTVLLAFAFSSDGPVNVRRRSAWSTVSPRTRCSFFLPPTSFHAA